MSLLGEVRDGLALGVVRRALRRRRDEATLRLYRELPRYRPTKRKAMLDALLERHLTKDEATKADILINARYSLPAVRAIMAGADEGDPDICKTCRNRGCHPVAYSGDLHAYDASCFVAGARSGDRDVGGHARVEPLCFSYHADPPDQDMRESMLKLRDLGFSANELRAMYDDDTGLYRTYRRHR